MTNTKVLVVDDSAVVRNQVVNWISGDATLELAGTAANGRQALEKFEKNRPDVVVLDIEMPLMDGLETLKALRALDARIPVIMFSTLTHRGATATLDALALGASDYVPKPTNLGEVRYSATETRAQLLEKIRHLSPRHRAAPTHGTTRLERGPVPNPTITLRPRPRLPTGIDAVVIGASTGGPNVLTSIFRSLPADFPAPILIAQHMPPVFTRYLAERLTAASGIKVQEAIPGRAITAGEAWIAPGGYHLVVNRKGTAVVLDTNLDPPEHSCRPSVNVLFRSAARVYGNRLLAVMLTGMGQDGLEGSTDIAQAGGEIIVQDEPSSIVWAMPGVVARAGLASGMFPADDLAAAIRHRVMKGY